MAVEEEAMVALSNHLQLPALIAEPKILYLSSQEAIGRFFAEIALEKETNNNSKV
jgi:hypothetical protein